ncbi:hypothetical protein KIF24_07190 [Micromonospora sp. Llam7]|uniref:hypothetical protein n=1 Tax=Micromonospora tarapacensis TaxID=2835305 RepID=UPI001C837F71|nr:hypothetical protein [Micromonospora tarapacensis]MBX7265835.1 hypothetical protein [Micromonospora tarapacensis]
MSWRKDNRRRKQVERPFARRLKYESAKEALGRLVEWGGAGVGMLAGLAGAKYGMPVSPAVASTGGAIIGGMVGSQGKAIVVAGIDHLRERRDQRRAATAAAASHREWLRRSGSNGVAGSLSTPRPRGGSASIAGQVIGGLDNVVGQLDRASRQLAEIHRTMWASQNALNAVLAGGRPEVVRAVDATLSEARGLVHDSSGMLTGSANIVGGYRASI